MSIMQFNSFGLLDILCLRGFFALFLRLFAFFLIDTNYSNADILYLKIFGYNFCGSILWPHFLCFEKGLFCSFFIGAFNHYYFYALR